MNTILPKRKASRFLLSLAIPSLILPAMVVAQNTVSVNPGTLNYVEGQVSVEGRPITTSSVGQTLLEAGQYLATANGKVEVLLTPGIFLRLGSDTTVRMVSPDLTHTEVLLERGRVTVEVDEIYKQNRILIDQHDGQTQLLQNGLYEFNGADSTVRVFEGKAAVYPGNNYNTSIKPIEVKGGRQLALIDEPMKPQKFDKDQAKSGDALYAWSDLRSNYLGQANLALADQYAYSGASFYPGWYSAPGIYGYTWLPGNGLFWSPFGYGFYSPYYIYGGGIVYSNPIGRMGPHSPVATPTGGNRGTTASAFHGGVAAPRGSAGFSGSGGFHGGGGGGFHGGGGGGGHR